MSRKVIEHFRLTGPVTIQFLHDLDKDRFLLMEVNPRLGGGVICSIYAGAPITDYILLEAMGKSNSVYRLGRRSPYGSLSEGSYFQTLKRKCMMSPSCTTYSFPSTPIFPASFTAASDPSDT